MLMIKIDKTLFDGIQEKAQSSLRKRMNYDLRTQATDSDPT